MRFKSTLLHLGAAGLGLAAMLCSAACGGNDQDRVARDVIDAYSRMADILARVTDAETARAAEKDLADLAGKMKGIYDEIQGLENPSQKKAGRYKDEMQEAIARVTREMQRISAIPGAMEALGQVMEKAFPR